MATCPTCPAIVPFFRSYSGKNIDHFYTASATEVDEFEAAGYVLETTPGFVYTNQTCNSVPLYRLFSASFSDHFYTTSVSERSSAIGEGYADQGVVAYVPVPGVIIYGNSC
ncbi:hypothetical protein B0H13DRAFT_1623209 [Mycena leptocephala]|nr:hypothetical protein B0H13DRAFT_1623209 [Mycena leptocephala]